MKKYAEDLAKEYGFNTKEEYFDYIVCSLINGQRQQVRNLFNTMKGHDQEEFLTSYLDLSEGFHKSTLNICITELIQF